MEIDFDRIIDRKGTSCIKWDDLKTKFGREDLLPFWVADMDFPVPECIAKALVQRSHHPVFGYTFRSDTYYQSICSWYETRHNWQISRDWILNTPGVVPALSLAVKAFTEKGDKILVQPPVYDPFFAVIRSNERSLTVSPLILQDNRYQMDFADLEHKFRQGVRLMLFCSPHNPVGRVWQKAELEQLLALCREYGVRLISDEIHSDLVFRPCRHLPVAEIAGNYVDWIILNAPSKSFNIAGLCTGYAIIPDPELRRTYEKELEKSGLIIGNIFGIEALTAAYEEGQEWLERLLLYLQDNYRYIVDFLSREIPRIVP
ncbi:MAG: PatB family C-S lyase, partial [Candidatus Cloacimonetes bacterium]|nr:PatB family C-S lyase [Candidatus Cloacimonadota bacterium]